jgi:hypothetical protein
MLCSQQIIEAIKTRLLSGTDADNRVYADRLWPLTEDKLPAIRLYELRERVEPKTVHFPVLEEHELEVGVELCAKSVSGIDGVLSALKLQALQCLFDTQPHSTLGFTNVRMSHAGTGPMQPIETAASQIAQRTLQLSVRFSAFAHQPETFV